MKTVVSEFDIVLRVTPELAWLRLVGSTARSCLKARNYPSRLVNATVAAVGEATEQLVSLRIDPGKTAPFEVGFLRQDGVVHVHLVYDGSVPLNPRKETDYKVPSSGEELDETLERRRLHIVNQTMDRVFSRLNGERAFSVLMKYSREEEHALREVAHYATCRHLGPVFTSRNQTRPVHSLCPPPVLFSSSGVN